MVTQLREWGTNRVHALPHDPVGEWIIGAGRTCDLRLDDARRWTSRQHARLVRTPAAWTITDLESKNGLWIDDELRPSFALAPGMEIGIGSLRLIAENERLVAVRALLERLIGWSAARAAQVDRALRSVRELAAHRGPLVLRGDGDLVPAARALHRRAFGDDSPFIVNDPNRAPALMKRTGDNNVVDIAAAVRTAAGGTLCVRSDRTAMGLAEVRRRVDEAEAAVRLIICGQTATRIDDDRGSVIVLPSLFQRAGEIGDIIDEYAADALAVLGATPDRFTPDDAEEVRSHGPLSLGEIEIAVTRLAAIRHFGGVTRAAAWLGISHVALSRWLARRR